MIASFKRVIVVSITLLFVAACSFTEDTLWPALTGDDPAGSGEVVSIAASPEELDDEAIYVDEVPATSTDFAQASYEPSNALMESSPTGTLVGA